MSTLAEEMRLAALRIRKAAEGSCAAIEVISPALDDLQAIAGYHEQMAAAAVLADREAKMRAALERIAQDADGPLGLLARAALE